ncbi:hypothetical protein [Cryobacterium sp. PH29-G1]|uniref:hypothetical protein n=1 Tax=Cryobacterium sp. PH29-G1 TaxID=3046211 RepID=UPI0024B8FBC4|nr:hypothetical protein [Cryobacterium sp. PH29-G1]MDJ0349597.1 hypothetical protein [Cryobacterium sp. PH29-G1]
MALSLLVGMGSAIVGLLPWLMTGMVLPLQNLWALDTAADEMPMALLPFSQYLIGLIAGLIVTGSAIAGGVARVTRARHPLDPRALAVGMLIVQLGSLVQTAITVFRGLSDDCESWIYLAALVAGTLVAILLGQLLLLLIARAARPGAAIAASIAAVALGPWLNALVIQPWSLVTPSNLALLGLVRWVPAVIVGITLAWCGLATIRRVVAAIVCLLVLWIGSAAVPAVGAAVGSRVLARNPGEMLHYAGRVFVNVLIDATASALFVILAVAVMAGGLAVRWVIQRRRVTALPA